MFRRVDNKLEPLASLEQMLAELDRDRPKPRKPPRDRWRLSDGSRVPERLRERLKPLFDPLDS